MKLVVAMLTSPNLPLLPPVATASRLFLVGSTVGPIVDSLHNQCLLSYVFAPISLTWSWSPSHLDSSSHPFFCSSWIVPPLLGIAYIILGYILPRMIDWIIEGIPTNTSERENSPSFLQNRAIVAVLSTCAIIKLSEYLETHDGISLSFLNYHYTISLDAQTNVALMALADIFQWIALDGTPTALIAASITAFGGPLAELPFVANNLWHYNGNAADYFPLSGNAFLSGGMADFIVVKLFGNDYRELALSSITGPCYFAVTMDAISLGRYFYVSTLETK